jgi:hypothetical protein
LSRLESRFPGRFRGAPTLVKSPGIPPITTKTIFASFHGPATTPSLPGPRTTPALRLVPHLVSEAQKRRRGELSLSLLRTLQVQAQRASHDIVTLDESWFYGSTDHDSICLGSDETVSERARVSVQCKKLMVTNIWNLTGFHVIRVLPVGANSTATITRTKYSGHFGGLLPSPQPALGSARGPWPRT